MTGRRFLHQLAVFALGLGALNVASGRFLRHSVPWQLIHRIDDARPPIDDLFGGNSLMEAGLDLPAYEHAAGNARHGFNLALGATTPVEHDLLLRHAVHLHARRFFYGFFDTQLTGGETSGFADLAGNRGLMHYLDRETGLQLLAPDDPWTGWRVRFVAQLPPVVERLSFWARVERLRRSLADLGMPAADGGDNRFGRAADFGALEAASGEDFARECDDAAENKTPFNRAVGDLLDVAGSAGMRVILVEMPMPLAHRARFYSTRHWTHYEAHLRALARATGAEYVDASDWIGDDGFGDAVHLNDRGAAEFSRRLGEVQANY